MHQLPSSIVNKLRQHAADSPDKEVCGFIINDRHLGWTALRCANVHQDPSNNFAIAEPEYVFAESLGEILAVYHSHVNDNKTFSVEDVKASRSVQIPYVLVTKDLQIRYFDPTTIAPYEGREWCWVSTNCFTLFQDYYKQELGHFIPDFYPKCNKSWLKGDVGYRANLPLYGFRQVESNEEIQTHDVILMTLGLPYPNHVGIITDANTGKMLHHLEDCYSEAIVYGAGNNYYKSTHSVWRLK